MGNKFQEVTVAFGIADDDKTKISTLTTQVQLLDLRLKDYQSLQERINSITGEREVDKQGLSHLKQELATLKATLGEKEKTYNKERQRLQLEVDNLTKTSNAGQTTQQQLTQLAESKTKVDEQLKKVQAQLEAQEEKVKKLEREQQSQVQKALNDLRVTLTKEQSKLEEESKLLTKENKQLKEDKTKLTVEVGRDREAMMERHQLNVEGLNTEIASLRLIAQDIEILKTNNAKIPELNGQIAALRKQKSSESWQAEVDALNVQIADLTTKLKKKTDELASRGFPVNLQGKQSSDLPEIITTLTEKVAAHVTTNQTNQATLQDLRGQVSQHQTSLAEIERLNKEVLALQTKHDKDQETINGEATRVKETVTKALEEQKKSFDLAKQLAIFEAKEELQEKLTDQHKFELEKIQAQLKETQTHLTTVNWSNVALTHNNSSGGTILTEKLAALQSLQTSYQTLIQQKNEVDGELRVLRARHELMAQQHASALIALQEKHRTEVLVQSAEIERLKDQQATVLGQSSKEVKKPPKDDKAISNMKQINDALTKKADKLEQEVTEIEKKIKKLIEDHAKEIEQLEGQLIQVSGVQPNNIALLPQTSPIILKSSFMGKPESFQSGINFNTDITIVRQSTHNLLEKTEINSALITSYEAKIAALETQYGASVRQLAELQQKLIYQEQQHQLQLAQTLEMERKKEQRHNRSQKYFEERCTLFLTEAKKINSSIVIPTSWPDLIEQEFKYQEKASGYIELRDKRIRLYAWINGFKILENSDDLGKICLTRVGKIPQPFTINVGKDQRHLDVQLDQNGANAMSDICPTYRRVYSIQDTPHTVYTEYTDVHSMMSIDQKYLGNIYHYDRLFRTGTTSLLLFSYGFSGSGKTHLMYGGKNTNYVQNDAGLVHYLTTFAQNVHVNEIWEDVSSDTSQKLIGKKIVYYSGASNSQCQTGIQETLSIRGIPVQLYQQFIDKIDIFHQHPHTRMIHFMDILTEMRRSIKQISMSTNNSVSSRGFLYMNLTLNYPQQNGLSKTIQLTICDLPGYEDYQNVRQFAIKRQIIGITDTDLKPDVLTKLEQFKATHPADYPSTTTNCDVLVDLNFDIVDVLINPHTNQNRHLPYGEFTDNEFDVPKDKLNLCGRYLKDQGVNLRILRQQSIYIRYILDIFEGIMKMRTKQENDDTYFLDFTDTFRSHLGPEDLGNWHRLDSATNLYTRNSMWKSPDELPFIEMLLMQCTVNTPMAMISVFNPHQGSVSDIKKIVKFTEAIRAQDDTKDCPFFNYQEQINQLENQYNSVLVRHVSQPSSTNIDEDSHIHQKQRTSLDKSVSASLKLSPSSDSKKDSSSQLPRKQANKIPEKDKARSGK
jgi:hypothetical protein